MARKKLGEILIEAGLLDETQLRVALGEQKRWGGTIGRVLIDMRIVEENALVAALSRQLTRPPSPPTSSIWYRPISPSITA